jgi:arginine deiminase
MEIDVRSEIGELQGVILHTPGLEVENMTPKNAERALYSDILNLPVAQREYAQLAELLAAATQTYQIRDLLESVLAQPMAKETLLLRVCEAEGWADLVEDLLALPPKPLARQLIEGVVMPRDNLTRFLSEERFSLPPLHNFFFTRDAAMAMGKEILIGRMAKPIRARESIILEAVFKYSPLFGVDTVNPADRKHANAAATIEGGDVLVARDDVLVVGNGSRTSSQGIDLIIEHLKTRKGGQWHILVQELPLSPESFIHLDMVFTFLDRTQCMVFEPLMLKSSKYQTIHIIVDNGRVTSIHEEKGLVDALRGLGMELTAICCGGKADLWTQEREQWHSGANFFALAPGKVVGYARNTHTMEELSRNGFEIVPANDVITGRRRLTDPGRFAISLEGSELPRGGGGARCMTLPIRRRPVAW